MQALRPGDVLVVESDAAFRAACCAALEGAGHHTVACATMQEGRVHLERTLFDVVLCARQLLDGSGVNFCDEIKTKPDWEHISVAMMVESSGEGAGLASSLVSGAWEQQDPPRTPPDDLLFKPLSAEELLVKVRTLLRSRRYRAEIINSIAALTLIAEGVEEQDKRAVGHCKRLSIMAVELGATLGCDDWQLTALERAGYLHDIGKVSIAGATVEKTQALTPREVQIIQNHCILGERLCQPITALKPVLPIVRHHHERGDGTGYPDGLRSDEIPILAQIFSIPDIYDALRMWRPYRPAMAPGQAIGVIRQEVERGYWNRAIFEAFIERVLPGLDERLQNAGVFWASG